MSNLSDYFCNFVVLRPDNLTYQAIRCNVDQTFMRVVSRAIESLLISGGVGNSVMWDTAEISRLYAEILDYAK